MTSNKVAPEKEKVITPNKVVPEKVEEDNLQQKEVKQDEIRQEIVQEEIIQEETIQEVEQSIMDIATQGSNKKGSGILQNILQRVKNR